MGARREYFAPRNPNPNSPPQFPFPFPPSQPFEVTSMKSLKLKVDKIFEATLMGAPCPWQLRGSSPTCPTADVMKHNADL